MAESLESVVANGITRGVKRSPVEEPCLALNSKREDNDTDETDGEECKDDPECILASVGRVKVVVLWRGLSVSNVTCTACLSQRFPVVRSPTEIMKTRDVVGYQQETWSTL